MAMQQTVNPFLNRAVFVFSLLGLMVAGYLWYMHANPADIPCGGSHGCETVANSPYARFPVGWGLPVAAYGALGYLAITALAFTRTLPSLAVRDKKLLGFILLGAAFGVVASLYLTYLEFFVIRAICRWCVGSQFIILIVAGLALVEWATYGKRTATTATEKNTTV